MGSKTSILQRAVSMRTNTPVRPIPALGSGREGGREGGRRGREGGREGSIVRLIVDYNSSKRLETPTN